MNQTARGTAASLERLQRRDQAVLVAYGLSAFGVIIAGELLAFYLDLADRIGFIPLAVRGIVYVTLTTTLWSCCCAAIAGSWAPCCASCRRVTSPCSSLTRGRSR